MKSKIISVAVGMRGEEVGRGSKDKILLHGPVASWIVEVMGYVVRP